jgi:hypothetical protein
MSTVSTLFKKVDFLLLHFNFYLYAHVKIALGPAVPDPVEAGHHRTRLELLQLLWTRSACLAGVGLDESGASHFRSSSSTRALRLVPRAPLANLAVHWTVHVAPLFGRRWFHMAMAVA